MRIYLARHAQVTSNKKEVNFNNFDESLTDYGKEESKKMAKRLAWVKIDKVFISNTKRAYETILPLLELKDIPFQRDERLNEADFGIFNGLTLKEAKQKYPDVYKRRSKDKYNVRIPKGESYADVALRLSSFFQDLQKGSKKKTFLIVTHATVLKVFLIYFLNYSVVKVDSIHFRNTSISIFDFSNKKWSAIKINDYSHLEQK